MTVVSDASPLNYLVLIGQIDSLAALFGQVLAPPAVIDELRNVRASAAVQAWAMNPPNWLTIQAPQQIDPTTGRGRGEREAISLALELLGEGCCIFQRRFRRSSKRTFVPARSCGGGWPINQEAFRLD